MHLGNEMVASLENIRRVVQSVLYLQLFTVDDQPILSQSVMLPLPIMPMIRKRLHLGERYPRKHPHLQDDMAGNIGSYRHDRTRSRR